MPSGAALLLGCKGTTSSGAAPLLSHGGAVSSSAARRKGAILALPVGGAVLP